MPLPDKRILNRFLEDYLEVRQATWKSPLAAIKNTMVPVLAAIPSFFGGGSSAAATEFKDDASLRNGLVKTLQERFTNASKPEDWINILLDLGEQGRKAQAHRSSVQHDSLFCETLNAMRSYIISELSQDQAFLGEAVKKFLADKAQNDELIFQAKQKSQAVKDLEETRDRLLYTLSDLNEERSIFEAAERGLFKVYQFPSAQEWHELAHTRSLASTPTVNFHKPWCYQHNFHLLYHEKRIQPLVAERFDDFKQRAAKNGSMSLKPAEVPAAVLPVDGDGDKDKGKLQEQKSNSASSLDNTAKPSAVPAGPLDGAKLDKDKEKKEDEKGVKDKDDKNKVGELAAKPGDGVAAAVAAVVVVEDAVQLPVRKLVV